MEDVLATVKEQKLSIRAASGGWNSCYVELTGPAEDGKIYILLREQNGKFKCWFSADPKIAKDALSVALAALINKKLCLVALTDTSPYSEIQRFYICG